MLNGLIVVRAAWDDDAGVWYTESSDLFGLNAEAPTLEALRDKLPAIAADLIADNHPDRIGDEFAIEIIAHTHTGAGDRVKGYGKAVREALRQAGCEFVRHGKGDHEVWRNRAGKRLSANVLSFAPGIPHLTRLHSMPVRKTQTYAC